jgi:hypothetical protein
MAVDAWRRPGTNDGAVILGVAAQVYPIRSAGWFVEAGLGRSAFRSPAVDGPAESGVGIGLSAGTGYDLRVGADMSFAPAIRLHYGNQGDVGSPILQFTDGSKLTTRTAVRETLLVFGLGFKFH